MRRGILVLAAGADWEPAAVEAIETAPGLVLLRRCVDVDDLLAAVAMGQADGAVVSLDVPGLDADAVAQIRRAGMTLIAVLPLLAEAGRARAGRLGITVTVETSALTRLPELIVSGASETSVPGPRAEGEPAESLAFGSADGAEDEPPRHRVLAVCGTRGAPGASTLATSIAAALAGRGESVTLIDADPRGGSVAHQLGILDEVSGVLAAARLQVAGELPARWAESVRRVAEGWLVVTGVPRSDRWREVADGTVEELIAQGASAGWVVVDAGAGPHEEVLAGADEVIVVGAPDPVGVARLCRLLDGFADQPELSVRVVLNRWRRSLGTSERDLVDLLGEVLPAAPVHLLPEDQAAADRAAVRQRAIREVAPTAAWSQAVEELTDRLAPAARPARVRRRRAGTAHRR